MKITFKLGFVICLLLLISAQGISQSATFNLLKKPKKIKLVNPLDLHFKTEINQKPSIIKQPSIFNAEHLPIFCKIEHKMAKSSNVNFAMRLGSLDYVNKLEGKN